MSRGPIRNATGDSFFAWEGDTLVVNILGKPAASKDAIGKPMGTQLKVSVTDTAKEYIVDEGSDPLYGARPLKRYLQSRVETLLARKIIASDIAPDTTLVIDKDENGLFVR